MLIVMLSDETVGTVATDFHASNRKDREWVDYRVKVRLGQVKFRQKSRAGSEGQEWNSELPCAKEGRQGQEGSCAEK